MIPTNEVYLVIRNGRCEVTEYDSIGNPSVISEGRTVQEALERAWINRHADMAIKLLVRPAIPQIMSRPFFDSVG